MIGTLLEKLFVSVGVDLSGFGTEMGQASKEVGKIAGEMKRSFADVGASWKATGDKMKKTGLVMSGAITAPLALFGKQAVRSAIDAQEMQSAFEVVFGTMADDVEDWAKRTGDAMGRSTQELQRGALAFQELFGKALDPAKAADLSKEFAVLTQDLASFKNLSNEVAQQKLFSGLTGEAEPLRAVGVFLNEAAVEAKLLEMGIEKVNGKFTDQQKILGRAAVIREQLAAAEGDVMRTADGTANRIRASQAAYEELSITVGSTLIPALTPLISMLTSMLEGFNQLDPGMQTFIVGAAGIAAILGPIITAVGALVTAFGVLLPFLSGIGTVLSVIGGAIATALGIPLAAVVAIVGAVVAAWYYWDEIKVIVASVGTAISDWFSKNVKPTFDAVMAAITPLVALFRDTFGAGITGTIKIVSALLKGDFSGAWAAAKQMAVTMIQGILNAVNALAPGAIAAMASLYNGVKSWLQDKLGAVFNWLQGKLKAVGQMFFDLYDAVVGHSYIPDMVDEIGQNMTRLQGLMVDPAKKATDTTKEAFKGLAGEVSGILDRLFPLQAQLKSVLEDIAALDKAKAAGLISGGTYTSARDKLETERLKAERAANPVPIASPDLQETNVEFEKLGDVLGELPSLIVPASDKLREFGEQLGDSIMSGLSAVLTGRASVKDVLRDMFSNFLESTINNALKSLESSIFGEGGLGGALGGIFSSLFSSITGRAVGGPTVPNRAYTVGNSELFVPGQHGRVLSRNDAMRAVGSGGGGIGRISVSVSGARGNQEIMEMVRQGVQQGIGQYDRVVGSRVDNSFKRRA